MTMENPPETLTSSAVANASIELLERLNAAESPLSIVSSALLSLATTLGVDRAIVAIDDPHYGRQVFCSGRRLLGDDGDLLWGPPRMRTAPPLPIHDTYSRLIIAAVATAFERAQASQELATTGPDALINAVRASVDRCARYGWGFTLVLIRLDEGDNHTLAEVEAHLRASDTLLELSKRDIAILLPSASDHEVPSILARVGQGGAVSTFCYGLAACPGDSAEASALLALAAARLHDAESTRDDSEIHAIESPKV
jgi:hypothetical protein